MINHMSLFEAIAASPSVKTLGTCTTDSWSFFFLQNHLATLIRILGSWPIPKALCACGNEISKTVRSF